MCFSTPKPPKPDPATIAAQQAQAQAEQDQRAKLKADQLKQSKGLLSGSGVRSLIGSSSGSGFGRNFFG